MPKECNAPIFRLFLRNWDFGVGALAEHDFTVRYHMIRYGTTVECVMLSVARFRLPSLFPSVCRCPRYATTPN